VSDCCADQRNANGRFGRHPFDSRRRPDFDGDCAQDADRQSSLAVTRVTIRPRFGDQRR